MYNYYQQQVPYGNYYVFELGKKGADFKASSTVNGDDSNIDLNPLIHHSRFVISVF